MLPILLYGSETWGLAKSKLEAVAAFHRRQLRALLGIRWPHRISNEALYKVTGTRPLCEIIRRGRLRLLGHVLRMPRETPAQEAMDFYVKPGKRRTGRPRTCLPTMLGKDLNAASGARFRTKADLEALREVAADRDVWRALVKHP